MKLAQRVCLRGRFRPPGDKSIAHREALLASLAEGTSVLENFATGDDCRRTLNLLEALGVPIRWNGNQLEISGRGYFGYGAPEGVLDAGNSGSTARMASGILAAQRFDSRLSGDESLRRRPMERVIRPLEQMGAHIESHDGRLPMTLRGTTGLSPLEYRLPVPSAQVKTAVLLAGLHCSGITSVAEPVPSRDHTELALARYGVPVSRRNDTIELKGGTRLQSHSYRLPGDISSAAFFIAGASFLPSSEVVVEEVGLNPTRSGFLDVLNAMGARIRIESKESRGGEPVGTLVVSSSSLVGTEIGPENIPALIDEIPILAVAAAFAEGETFIRGAAELRFKETDRLRAISEGLVAMGVDVQNYQDGIRIRGGSKLRSAELASEGDHRMAMAWAVASLGVDGSSGLSRESSVAVSYPDFWKELNSLAI